MKFSKYNVLLENETKFYIYNSLSNSLLKIEEKMYQDFYFKKNLEQYANIEEFIRAKIYVNNDFDEIEKKNYLTLLNRFRDDILCLTIAPTQDCNFNCKYCYELSRPQNYMDENTINDLLVFIESYKNVKEIFICWYGGEPLMSFENILKISNKILLMNKILNAAIITNGYLLNEEISEKLEKLHIRFIQITIDGLENIHNERRPLIMGGSSFEKIIKNISYLLKINMDIQISIRVNIDNENVEEYAKVYNYFRENFSEYLERIFIYPGFVTDYTDSCNSSSCFSTTKQKEKFLTYNFESHGIYHHDFFPKTNVNNCIARDKNSFLIDPQGNLYKCWAVIGNPQMKVGNIKQGITNPNILIRFLKGADQISDQKCQKCQILPICDGGCPYMRIQKKYENKKIDFCHIGKYNLERFLKYHIQYKNKTIQM